MGPSEAYIGIEKGALKYEMMIYKTRRSNV